MSRLYLLFGHVFSTTQCFFPVLTLDPDINAITSGIQCSVENACVNGKWQLGFWHPLFKIWCIKQNFKHEHVLRLRRERGEGRTKKIFFNFRWNKSIISNWKKKSSMLAISTNLAKSHFYCFRNKYIAICKAFQSFSYTSYKKILFCVLPPPFIFSGELNCVRIQDKETLNRKFTLLRELPVSLYML